VRARSTAPEGLLAGTSGGRINSGNGRSIALSELDLLQHVLDALRQEGIADLGAWRKLGRRRFQLFGITPRTVEMLDSAAREAQR
jgi:hypothetical protein